MYFLMQPNLPQMKQNNSLLTRLIVSSLSVFLAGWLLPGVQIDSFTTAVGIAIVFGLLNATLKPLLIVITIPITVMSLGLFLLIINAIIIGVADQWIDGLHVRSTWTAILFSFLISTISSWMYRWGENR
jgi:putative membrane protein